MKTVKIQKPLKLLKPLWEQEKSFWEGPTLTFRFSSRSLKIILSPTFRGPKFEIFLVA
jgi:hypothetical protein